MSQTSSFYNYGYRDYSPQSVRFTEYRYSPDGRGVEVVEDGGYQVHLTSYSNTNGCIGVKSESTMNTLIEYVELYPGTSKIVVVSGKETTGGKYD